MRYHKPLVSSNSLVFLDKCECRACGRCNCWNRYWERTLFLVLLQ